MKLLVVTQKIDRNDPVLGFFHNWVIKLSEKFEKVSVVCLQKGEYDLPKNVQVFSLGKESSRSKIKYVKNFLNLILGLHREYDAVFVHMNQEYVLLGGFIWKLMGKKVYMWRNHPDGTILTDISAWLSNGLFCTSEFSYIKKYKKTKLMPVGIDMKQFSIINSQFSNNKNKEILFLGRIGMIKKPDLLVEAVGILNKKGVDFECNFYGDPLPKDEEFYASIKNKAKELDLENKVNFYKAVPNYETPKIYNEHGIFINLTPSGSFDKTILEAAACGCIVVVVNQSLSGKIDERMIAESDEPANVAKTIEFWLGVNDEERLEASQKLQKYVLENHSLSALIEELCIRIKK